MISIDKMRLIYESIEKGISTEILAIQYEVSVATIEDYARRWKKYLKRVSTDSNILIIPDPHAPFIRDGYLDFCIEMKKKWECEKIIFLGDLIDNHYSSFHETDPDGYSATEELDKAIEQIQGFYSAFPHAVVTIGNHDAIPNRKAFSSGVSARWVKSVDEMLKVPNWEFKETHWEGNIMFCHGLGRKAHTRMKQDMVSVVQGHYHSESYIRYQVGRDRKTFAMQLGCGIDHRAYAAAYAKHFMRQHINVGVLLKGKVPLIEYMEL